MPVSPSDLARLLRRDLYADLDADPEATPEELQAAARAAFRRWHPDRCPDPDAPERFRAAREAWEVLRDERLRGVYDAARRVQRPPGPTRDELPRIRDTFMTIFKGSKQR